jgi:hypothetical protein
VADSTFSSLLIAVGGIVILAGVGLAWYQRVRPTPPDPGLVEQFVVEREQMPIPILASTFTPHPIPASPSVLAPTAVPTPTPTPEPYVIEGIRYDRGAPIEFYFHVPPHDVVEIPQVTVQSYRAELFDDPNFFQPGDRVAISYLDDYGRVGLWIHSGGRQTAMYPLQKWLEQHVAPPTFGDDKVLLTDLELLKGYDVDVIVADQYTGFMQVAAAVRVPPMEVPELTTHVGDIIPYLAERYPASDFHLLEDNQQVLFLYFCGLAMEGEERNPEANKWTQARFVVALTTSWDYEATKQQ